MNARLVSRRRAPARQQGVSLLVVLILMVVMSVLGIAVLRSSAMQERMSANMYDRSLATQAAEAALVEARAWLGSDSGVDWSTQQPAEPEPHVFGWRGAVVGDHQPGSDVSDYRA